MSRAGRFLANHVEIGILGTILGVIQFFPKSVPGGIYGLGMLSGAFIAVQAVGLILVYRSNRIINFAQVQVGIVAATVFTLLVQFRPLFRAYNAICPSCKISERMIQANYWLALITAMGLAIGLSYGVYVLVIKRFSDAPRLIVTVATVFVAQLLGGIQGLLPTLLTTEDQRLGGLRLAAPKLPFSWSFSWDPVRYDSSQILIFAVGVVAVIGLTIYFKFTNAGAALRAASEDSPRAQMLGVKVGALNGRVWMVAGALSGAAAVISAMSSPPLGQASLDVGGMVRILAVALMARMVSLPLAAAGALVLGILFQSVLWAWGSNELLDAVVFGMIVIFLLFQKDRQPAELKQASAWRAAREIRPIPRELRWLPPVRTLLWSGAAAGGFALLGLPWVLSPSQSSVAALTVIYALVGLSLLIVTGWAGHISLGQFGVAAVGAYAAVVLKAPFLIALPMGALAGALAAVVVGIPALRIRGLHLAVMTLAFSTTVPIVLLGPSYLGRYLPDSLRRPSALGVDLDDQRTFYYVCLAVLALAFTAVLGLRRGTFARGLIAARDNERAASAFGINSVRARLGAYAVSGSLAGLAGALYAFHQYGVRPTGFLPETSVSLFNMTVIGGLGSASGPLIGAVYFGALSLFSTNQVVAFLATGGGGLALLLLQPGGLSQTFFGLRDSWLRSLAHRRSIRVPSLTTELSLGRDSQRAPIAPRSGGAGSFVPSRYRLRPPPLGGSVSKATHASLPDNSDG